MTDIVERLRHGCSCNFPDTPCGAEEECRAAFDAADEITRLRADNERLTRQFAEHADRTADDTAALRDEVERLRAVLQNVYMTTRCDKTAAKALAALGFTPVPNGQTALSSWRPIDQPPIHPMRVLLFSPDQYDANWNGADYGIRVAYFANGHWRDQGTNHDACEFDTPTHWMPLPPAPGKEEA